MCAISPHSIKVSSAGLLNWWTEASVLYAIAGARRSRGAQSGHGWMKTGQGHDIHDLFMMFKSELVKSGSWKFWGCTGCRFAAACFSTSRRCSRFLVWTLCPCDPCRTGVRKFSCHRRKYIAICSEAWPRWHWQLAQALGRETGATDHHEPIVVRLK